MNIHHLDHLVITAADPEASWRFYTEILAMEPDTRSGRLAVKFGNQKINIHRKKAEFLPAAKNVTYGSQDLCLIADGKIEDIRAEIEAKGYPVELGIVRRTGAMGPIDSIYLRDPDGNLVEISTYV